MTLLDKVKKLFGGAAEKTGDLAEKAGDAATEVFVKVEDAADSVVDRIDGDDDSPAGTTPGGHRS